MYQAPKRCHRFVRVDRFFGSFVTNSMNLCQSPRWALTDLCSGHHSTEPCPITKVPPLASGMSTSTRKSFLVDRLVSSTEVGRWATTVNLLDMMPPS